MTCEQRIACAGCGLYTWINGIGCANEACDRYRELARTEYRHPENHMRKVRMSEHRSWAEISADLEKTPGYRQAKRELDEAWEIECRYGNCTVFVSADSNVREDLGGWGPIGCPCKANDDPYCPDDDR